MDYSVQLASQLKQLLKSLRKSRQMTQAQLAQRLGVVQSRVADIERDPGAVSVEQMLQVLAMLGAQLVVRPSDRELPATEPSTDGEANARAPSAGTATPTKQAGPTAPTPAPPESPPDDEPRGQW